MCIFQKLLLFLRLILMKNFSLLPKFFSFRWNLKEAKVLKFCPLLGAVKIFVLRERPHRVVPPPLARGCLQPSHTFFHSSNHQDGGFDEQECLDDQGECKHVGACTTGNLTKKFTAYSTHCQGKECRSSRSDQLFCQSQKENGIRILE